MAKTLSWQETKFLIIEAVGLGAETVEEVHDYLLRNGSQAKSPLSIGGYLSRAVKEGAIESDTPEHTKWRVAPAGYWKRSPEERDAERITRRQRYFAYRGWPIEE